MKLTTVLFALSAALCASAQNRGVSVRVTDGRTLDVWIPSEERLVTLKSDADRELIPVGPNGEADGLMVVLSSKERGVFQVSCP